MIFIDTLDGLASAGADGTAASVVTLFDGLKPSEVIERGESDRLWEMVY
ncbi:MAG: hypothetical protein HC834_03445, partial [Rhodospirillales bacterium]|nr:hypothetical protein [Rhodospirillales bacterium]